MRSILAALSCLLLCGCLTDPKQQLAACQSENAGVTKPTGPKAATEVTFVLSKRIELCMAQHEYVIVSQTSQECSNPTMTDPSKLASHELGRATSARCYSPKSWVMQQVIALQRQIGVLR